MAVLLVVTYHAGLFGFKLPSDWQRFGWIGVDLFFVLSGYLIGRQLLGQTINGRRPDLRRFFWRRALRILPAYLVAVTVYALLPSLREWPTLPPVWKFLVFVQNIDLHGGTAFSHAWSLSVEAQFYCVLPFILPILSARKHLGVIVVIGVVLAGMTLRGVIASGHPALLPATGVSWRAFQRLIYYPTWSRLDPLIAGVGLAAVQVHRPRDWSFLNLHARWLICPALICVAAGVWLSDGDTLTVAACICQFPLIALGMALLLICMISEQLPFSHRPLPGAGFFASIAYSVYLSHKLVIHQAQDYCLAHHLPPTSALAVSGILLMSLVVGAGLFFAVERPFLQLRRDTSGSLSTR